MLAHLGGEPVADPGAVRLQPVGVARRRQGHVLVHEMRQAAPIELEQVDVPVEGSRGDRVLVEAGRQQLKGKIEKSGSWFTYRKEKIGSLQLPAGKHRIVFRPADKSKKGALLDLRELTLVRVK
mgnify:CR=1 FL=1